MDTLQLFDNQSIDLYEGKFSGSFECEPSMVDTEGYFVVRFHTKGAAFGEDKSGNLKRTDVHAVLEAVRIPDATGIKLVAQSSPQLSFQTVDDQGA